MIPRRSAVRRRAGVLISGALALGLAVALVYGWATGAERSDLAHRNDNLLRLHIVAHSNAPEDQQVKLRVRDALLEEMATWGTPASRSEAESWVVEREEELVRIAEFTLKEAGFDLPVRVDVGTFAFPTKRTGAIVLPAGEYRAINVVIGDGAGHNWWCVLFPPLCFVEDEGTRVGEPQTGGPQAGVPAEGFSLGGPALTVAENPGEATAAGEGEVEWRLRLWESLSESAYAERFRDMIHVSLQTLFERDL